LRVLQPNDPDSYFTTREIVPQDMIESVKKAKIVITNFHAYLATLSDSRQSRGRP